MSEEMNWEIIAKLQIADAAIKFKDYGPNVQVDVLGDSKSVDTWVELINLINRYQDLKKFEKRIDGQCKEFAKFVMESFPKYPPDAFKPGEYEIVEESPKTPFNELPWWKRILR